MVNQYELFENTADRDAASNVSICFYALRTGSLGFVAYAYHAPVMYIYTLGVLGLCAYPKNQLL